jgi:universal stress protein A
MADYTHILLAVDFSAGTDRVVEVAKSLRDKYGARLSLIHVVDFLPPTYAGDQMLPGYVGDMMLPENVETEQVLIKRAKEQLEDLAKRHGIEDFTRWVEVGSPKEEITRMAEDNKVDLILVGSHGRRGLQLLLGSTANGVLHGAPCDVLAVRVGKD